MGYWSSFHSVRVWFLATSCPTCSHLTPTRIRIPMPVIPVLDAHVARDKIFAS